MKHARLPLRARVIAFVIAALAGGQCASAASAIEAENLELIIRQLAQAQRVAQRNSELSTTEGERYHFDYQRLQQDLDTVRKGLETYMTPTRAQPRDPGTLSGHYTRTGPVVP
ncbi:integrative conjugative element protein, RAQPRD family [Pseudomonas caricapapayae]|uniref:integrative conjugative element protein, RAQPRD family n=1 Tax=Pseudomonas caricapapayae TaxID=46678 RepID=UPI000EFF0BFA|nr:RAQPRD family integrative conjugative element protein [Pseudomonas caricapapayae]